jgi:hypothetical protein
MRKVEVAVPDLEDYLVNPDPTTAQVRYATASFNLMHALADLADAVQEVEPDGCYHGTFDEDVDAAMERFTTALKVARQNGKAVLQEQLGY